MWRPKLKLALAGAVWLIASLAPMAAYAKGETYYWKDFNTVGAKNGLYGDHLRTFPKSHQDKNYTYYRAEFPCTVNGVQYGRTVTVKTRTLITRSYPTGAEVEQNTASDKCKLDLDKNVSIHETAAKAGITFPDSDGDGITDDTDPDDDNDGAPDSIDRDDDGDGIDDVDEGKTTTTPPPTTPASSEGSDKCDAGTLTFFFCGAIRNLESAIQGLEQNLVANFLDIKPLGQKISVNGKETDDPRYVLWKAFKNLTNAFFVLVFLFIIFANITSINIDAYTIKKMLPKLVVAAILVQFSWFLSSVAVDAANVAGKGIFLFIDSTLSRVDGAYNFGSFSSGLTLGIAATATVVATGAFFLSVMSGSILLFLFGAFIGILTVFVTLFFRQIVITAMVVLSPLAFVAFVLPNTEGFYKLWSKNFLRLLLMYPIIMLLFASGKVFSVIAGATGGNLAPLFALVALVIPLFMVPATFKLAGSAMIAGAGAISKLSSAGKSKLDGMGGMQRYKEATERRKIEMAAGQKVKGFGFVPTKASQRAARGVFGGIGKGAQTRAAVAFNKAQARMGKRQEEEGLSYEGREILSKGKEWYDQQLLDHDTKVAGLQAALASATDPNRQRELSGQINSMAQKRARLQNGLNEAQPWLKSTSARAAAAFQRGRDNVIDDDDRKAITGYTTGGGVRVGGYLAGNDAGQAVATRLWSQAREGGRKGNVHLAYTDLEGNIDNESLKSYVKGQNQSTWSNYSEGAYKALEANGTLSELAATASGRTMLEGLTGAGGPSAGHKQQEIINRVLSGSGGSGTGGGTGSGGGGTGGGGGAGGAGGGTGSGGSGTGSGAGGSGGGTGAGGSGSGGGGTGGAGSGTGSGGSGTGGGGGGTGGGGGAGGAGGGSGTGGSGTGGGTGSGGGGTGGGGGAGGGTGSGGTGGGTGGSSGAGGADGSGGGTGSGGAGRRGSATGTGSGRRTTSGRSTSSSGAPTGFGSLGGGAPTGSGAATGPTSGPDNADLGALGGNSRTPTETNSGRPLGPGAQLADSPADTGVTDYLDIQGRPYTDDPLAITTPSPSGPTPNNLDGAQRGISAPPISRASLGGLGGGATASNPASSNGFGGLGGSSQTTTPTRSSNPPSSRSASPSPSPAKAAPATRSKTVSPKRSTTKASKPKSTPKPVADAAIPSTPNPIQNAAAEIAAATAEIEAQPITPPTSPPSIEAPSPAPNTPLAPIAGSITLPESNSTDLSPVAPEPAAPKPTVSSIFSPNTGKSDQSLVLFFDENGKPQMLSEAQAKAREEAGNGHIARDSNNRIMRGGPGGNTRYH